MSFTGEKMLHFLKLMHYASVPFLCFGGQNYNTHTLPGGAPPLPCEESKYIPSKPATQVVKKLCLFVKWIDKTVFIKMDVIPGFFLHE